MTSKNKKNIDWEKGLVKIIKKYTHHIQGGEYFELIDGFMALEQFFAKELAKKDKEFIEILNGLEMEEKYIHTYWGMGKEEKFKNIEIKGYNSAAKKLNNKIKQIKKKYE